MSGSQAKEDAAGGPFAVTHRLILSIAVPMTLGFLTTPLIGITGTVVAGHTGRAEDLAGLAIGAVLFDLLFSTFNFLRASTTGLTAQALGRGDRAGQRDTFWRAFLSALAAGLLILLVSPLLLAAGLWIMAPEGGAREAASLYFTIRVLSSPLALANYVLLGFVLGRGQGRLGLLLQVVLNGTNIVFSILLGLWAGMGIAGIAWGAVIGESVAALAGLAIVLAGFPRGLPALSRLLDRGEMRALFSLNRDIMIRSFVLIAAFALMTRIGASFGTVTLAANAVLMNFLLVSAFFLDGMATAAEQLAGRAIGAHYRPAFDRMVKLTALWSVALSGLLALFFFIFGNPLIAMTTDLAEVRATAATFLPWAAISGLAGVLAFLMDGIFIGATWSRDMRNMMLASLAGYCLALAVLVPAFGNHGLWLAFNLFLMLRGFFLLAVLPRRARQSFAAQ